MNDELSMLADIKLSSLKSSWESRLREISLSEGEIIICTYSFSDLSKIAHIIGKRQKDVTLIANTKFFNSAYVLKKKCPLVKLYLSPHSHAKMVLLKPKTVWVSTENFGRAQNSFDATVEVNSEEAYRHFYKQVQNFIKKPTTTEIMGV